MNLSFARKIFTSFDGIKLVLKDHFHRFCGGDKVEILNSNRNSYRVYKNSKKNYGLRNLFGFENGDGGQ